MAFHFLQQDQIPILLGAVFMVHRSEGFLTSGQSLEFSSLVLFLLAVFLVGGAGRLSLDYYVFGAGAIKLPDSASETQ